MARSTLALGRTTQAQDLLWSKYSTVWKENEDFKPDFLFKHSIAVDVYHEFFGIQSVRRRGNSARVNSQSGKVGCLDCLCHQVFGKHPRAKGGEKQKMYIRMFNKFLPQALSQILSSVSNITGVDENVTFAELKMIRMGMTATQHTPLFNMTGSMIMYPTS